MQPKSVQSKSVEPGSVQPRSVSHPLQDELTMAVGLVWGHLNAQQLQAAWDLAQGCLQLAPGHRALTLMANYAAAELGKPVDLAALHSPAADDPANAASVHSWIALIEHRAGVAP